MATFTLTVDSLKTPQGKALIEAIAAELGPYIEKALIEMLPRVIKRFRVRFKNSRLSLRPASEHGSNSETSGADDSGSSRAPSPAPDPADAQAVAASRASLASAGTQTDVPGDASAGATAPPQDPGRFGVGLPSGADSTETIEEVHRRYNLFSPPATGHVSVGGSQSDIVFADPVTYAQPPPNTLEQSRALLEREQHRAQEARERAAAEALAKQFEGKSDREMLIHFILHFESRFERLETKFDLFEKGIKPKVDRLVSQSESINQNVKESRNLFAKFFRIKPSTTRR